ncbi:BlaI/MecI/CopY family transcriptional regulator [Alkaliphilus crotonatoxidans]
MKRLPEAEFEIMKIVWENEPPITTSLVMQRLGVERSWKIQTIVSLMQRLIDRGFLRSEKHGKERVYYPIIDRADYLHFETGYFMKQYHKNSFLNLVNTLYEYNDISDEELDALLQWIEERRS